MNFLPPVQRKYLPTMGCPISSKPVFLIQLVTAINSVLTEVI